MNALWREVRDRGFRHEGVNHWVYEARGILFVGVGLKAEPDIATTLRRKEIVLPKYAWFNHVGSYAELGAVHAAIRGELRRRGLRPRFPAVEIYGHWRENEAEMETQVLVSVA